MTRSMNRRCRRSGWMYWIRRPAELELTQYATPVLSAGQNYALSPDGDRFAVLRDNAIEIYNLPPAAPGDRRREKAVGNQQARIWRGAN